MTTDKKHQTAGREGNAATPLNDETATSVTPERYPPTDKHDAIQAPANPQPRQGAGDGGPALEEGPQGPAGDPAEGRR